MGFRYYNSNPEGKRLEDCVCRAISTALNMDYYEVAGLLFLNGAFYDCDELCIYCYENLLDNFFGLEHYNVDYSITFNELAESLPNEIILIRGNGHLSCALYGEIRDIWDCSDMLVTDYWVI